jgi:hypothetical protein
MTWMASVQLAIATRRRYRGAGAPGGSSLQHKFRADFDRPPCVEGSQRVICRSRLVTRSYDSSDSGGVERVSSSSSGSAPASRTSVASNSVTTATPGTGSSTTSTTTVSTVGALGRFLALTFFRAFVAPRLSLAFAKALRGAGLAILRFAGLFRADLDGLRALGRAADFPFRAVRRFFR